MSSTTTRPQAVGYVRVSSAEQASGGESLPEQRRMIERWAEAEGIPLAGIFEDAGFSGGDRTRPGLTELLATVETGGVSRVVFAKQDRLARDTTYAMHLIDAIFGAGALPVSLTPGEVYGEWKSTDQGMTAMRGMADQAFRESISAGAKRGHRGHLERGILPRGNPPYGYRSGGKVVVGSRVERQPWQVDETEAETVREVHRLYLDEQASAYAIAGQLTDQGIPTSNGGRWRARRVLQILDNPIYSGLLAWDRTEANGSTPRPSSEWSIYEADPDFHPPILPAGTWHRVQVERERRATKGRPGTAGAFTGLITCSGCGGSMSVGNTHVQTDGFISRYYRCHRANERPGSKACPEPEFIAEWEVAAILVHTVAELVEQDGTTDIESVKAAARAEREAQVTKAKVAIRSAEQAIDRLLDAYEKGAYTVEQMTTRKAKHEAAIAEAETVINEGAEGEAEVRWAEALRLLADRMPLIHLDDSAGWRKLAHKYMRSVRVGTGDAWIIHDEYGDRWAEPHKESHDGVRVRRLAVEWASMSL